MQIHHTNSAFGAGAKPTKSTNEVRGAHDQRDETAFGRFCVLFFQEKYARE